MQNTSSKKKFFKGRVIGKLANLDCFAKKRPTNFDIQQTLFPSSGRYHSTDIVTFWLWIVARFEWLWGMNIRTMTSVSCSKQNNILGIYVSKQNNILGIYLSKQNDIQGIYVFKQNDIHEIYVSKQDDI